MQPKVLLVEDDLLIQRIMESRLRRLGCLVALARTAEEALSKCNNDICFVLLDIGLPDMSGIELCSRLRQVYNKSQLPIVAVTASDFLEAKCLEAGVNDFEVKPIIFTRLKMLLEKWIPSYARKSDVI